MNRRCLFLLLASSALVSPRLALADSCSFESVQTGLARELGQSMLLSVGYAAIGVGALIAVAVAAPVVAGAVGAIAASGSGGVAMVAFVGVLGVKGFVPGMRRVAENVGDQLASEAGAFHVDAY